MRTIVAGPYCVSPEVFDVLGQVVGLKDARAEGREQRVERYRSVATHCHFLVPWLLWAKGEAAASAGMRPKAWAVRATRKYRALQFQRHASRSLLQVDGIAY